MEGVQVKPPYVEKASRREMIYRVGYMILYMLVASIAAFVIYITWPLQVLSILIRGKRSYRLHKINIAVYEYFTEYFVYIYSETDQRPLLFPKIELDGKKVESKVKK